MSDSDQQHSKAAFPLIQPGTGTFIKKFALAEGSSALVLAEPTSLGAMDYRFVMAVSVGKKPRLFVTLETNRLTSMPAFSDLMKKHGLAESDLDAGPFLVIYADGMTTNIRQAPDLLTPDAFIKAAAEEAAVDPRPGGGGRVTAPGTQGGGPKKKKKR